MTLTETHSESAYLRLRDELIWFDKFGTKTHVDTLDVDVDGISVTTPVFTNEFWTSRQRAAHSLHEVSYRACFKPQLPEFFITRLTEPDGVVYDPFMGRGTTIVEAALLGRRPIGTDVNPLSLTLVEPRIRPPKYQDIEKRLSEIDLSEESEINENLLVFYHPETLHDLCALRNYLLERRSSGFADEVDKWIEMVAINRLTGHSPGFFSVYTMPPNQAVTIDVQKRLNEKRGQVPPKRNVVEVILKKTRALLAHLTNDERVILSTAGSMLELHRADASSTPEILSSSVDLVVTSPPFLDIVDYATDNWLRCWFIGIDARDVPITKLARLEAWQEKMKSVFCELHRVVKTGGYVAFEVGEVRAGKVRLEEAVIPAAVSAGFEPELVLINSQRFTKTSNTWGVANNAKGTNTNRVVLLRRP